MKVVVIIIILTCFAGCAGKEDYIPSSKVVETTRELFPAAGINLPHQHTKTGSGDSAAVISAVSELLGWIYSDSFRADYELFLKTKSYSLIDSKLNEIIRNNGFSSYREYELYLNASMKSEYIRKLSDSLKIATRERITKISKDFAEKK